MWAGEDNKLAMHIKRFVKNPFYRLSKSQMHGLVTLEYSLTAVYYLAIHDTPIAMIVIGLWATTHVLIEFLHPESPVMIPPGGAVPRSLPPQ
ncbi:hypothetical protein [Vulcanisaeta souniana]|nr:hypothetical protein [Vulcanisaeta souniana]